MDATEWYTTPSHITAGKIFHLKSCNVLTDTIVCNFREYSFVNAQEELLKLLHFPFLSQWCVTLPSPSLHGNSLVTPAMVSFQMYTPLLVLVVFFSHCGASLSMTVSVTVLVTLPWENRVMEYLMWQNWNVYRSKCESGKNLHIREFQGISLAPSL